MKRIQGFFEPKELVARAWRGPGLSLDVVDVEAGQLVARLGGLDAIGTGPFVRVQPNKR